MSPTITDQEVPPALVSIIPTIPQTPICLAALKLAHQHLSTPIFNHSLRVFYYTQRIIYPPPSDSPSFNLPVPTPDLLFLASIFHDFGTATCCAPFPLRFEVEGANAAVKLMNEYGYTAAESREVWIAIACHTSPHIAQRIGELARMMHGGVHADFAKVIVGTEHALSGELERGLPRLDLESVLGREVVEQALLVEGKAPHASWPWALVMGHRRGLGENGVNPEF